jgi:hypothetical protein
LRFSGTFLPWKPSRNPVTEMSLCLNRTLVKSRAMPPIASWTPSPSSSGRTRRSGAITTLSVSSSKSRRNGRGNANREAVPNPPHPSPGSPADEKGNFFPLPEWKPGQPKPANWPFHIHHRKSLKNETNFLTNISSLEAIDDNFNNSKF